LTSAQRPFTWRDPVGMLMALASTVAISIYFVLVAMTRGRLSDAAILYINYLAVRYEVLDAHLPCETRAHLRPRSLAICTPCDSQWDLHRKTNSLLMCCKRLEFTEVAVFHTLMSLPLHRLGTASSLRRCSALLRCSLRCLRAADGSASSAGLPSTGGGLCTKALG